MKKILFFILVCFTQVSISADASSEITAKYGGLVKKTENTIFEVVHEKERTNIYITGRGEKNISDQKLSLSAIAHVNGRKIPLELSFANNHYSAKPGNSYLQKEKNFVLMLTVTLPGSKTETAEFNLTNH